MSYKYSLYLVFESNIFNIFRNNLSVIVNSVLAMCFALVWSLRQSSLSAVRAET
jgi:hypothetical protein